MSDARGESGLPGKPFVFRLYVTGNSPRSTAAIRNATRLLEERLFGRFDLEIVDIYLQPHTAVAAQIVAVPTLLKVYPGLVRRVIGDLSDAEKVLSALEVPVDEPDLLARR